MRATKVTLMKSIAIKLIVLVLMLAYLPLFGAAAIGLPIERFQEFLGEARYLNHEPFSWGIFAVGSGIALAILAPFLFRIFICWPSSVDYVASRPWPWW